MLLACNPFAKTRAFECQGHPAINVEYEGAIDARALSEEICVNTVMQPYRYFHQPNNAFYRDGDDETVAAMMLDTPFIEYGTEVYQAQFAFDTEENETTSIHGPGGLAVLSDGAGMVALRDGANEVIIECADCDVWIPEGPQRLDLTMVRGTAHICLAGTTDLFLDLTDVTIEATVQALIPGAELDPGPGVYLIIHGVGDRSILPMQLKNSSFVTVGRLEGCEPFAATNDGVPEPAP